MPDTKALLASTVEAPRKMTLTAAERKLVLEHRAKTATDRAFNEGVTAALDIFNAEWGESGPIMSRDTFDERIAKLWRDV